MTFEGTLKEVNEKAVEVDGELAQKISAGEIDGRMFVSADPEGANAKAVEAAAKAGIPMAGTGGTGVALIQSKGCNVLSASGTTGTTNRTRAVAFTTALAKDGGIIGGLVVGILAGVLVYYISVFCYKHNVPGTTVNIASGALVGPFDVKGTAYLPSFVAPFMAQEGKGVFFLICMLVAMACACVITLAANKMYRAKHTQDAA